MKNLKTQKLITMFLLLVALMMSGCYFYKNLDAATFSIMKVHYIDVGQSDSVLIESNKHYMLIDAGDIDDQDTIVDYLNAKKIKKLDYFILTHPHADHIGSAEDVIYNFGIEKLIMPPKEHTTKTFEIVLDAIEKKGLKISKPVVGQKYKLGNASFKIIAPNRAYGDDLNNWSIGIKLTNGKNSFVFIGDNENESISDILKNGIDLKADVYMCGHHGSGTSTTRELLKVISPKYVVISCGKNNPYGHPHKNVLKMLSDNNITVYRTDKSGTIIATSNGNKVTFNKKASQKPTKNKTSKNQKANESTVKKQTGSNIKNSTNVYITYTGKKYHLNGCQYLKQSKVKVTLSDAKSRGYTPCSRCRPPK